MPDLKTETFLLCFRRFVSRRGLPQLVVSDNAKTFKAFSKVLQRMMKSPLVRNFLAEHRIKWKFNLAKSPWWGEFHERLIQGVKTCLKTLLGSALLLYDELHTAIVEIEGVLNSRPHTYQYPGDLEQPLTPSHLILGKILLQLPFMTPDKPEERDFHETPDMVQKCAAYQSKVLFHYLKRWKHEYLINLSERHLTAMGTPLSHTVKKGDIVLVEDENQRNRNFWKLGCIEELITGKDDVFRGAKLRMVNLNRIERPIQKLYPLKLSAPESGNVSISPEVEGLPDSADNKSIRPKRTTDIMARERWSIIDKLQKEQFD